MCYLLRPDSFLHLANDTSLQCWCAATVPRADFKYIRVHKRWWSFFNKKKELSCQLLQLQTNTILWWKTFSRCAITKARWLCDVASRGSLEHLVEYSEQIAIQRTADVLDQRICVIRQENAEEGPSGQWVVECADLVTAICCPSIFLPQTTSATPAAAPGADWSRLWWEPLVDPHYRTLQVPVGCNWIAVCCPCIWSGFTTAVLPTELDYMSYASTDWVSRCVALLY